MAKIDKDTEIGARLIVDKLSKFKEFANASHMDGWEKIVPVKDMKFYKRNGQEGDETDFSTFVGIIPGSGKINLSKHEYDSVATAGGLRLQSDSIYLVDTAGKGVYGYKPGSQITRDYEGYLRNGAESAIQCIRENRALKKVVKAYMPDADRILGNSTHSSVIKEWVDNAKSKISDGMESAKAKVREIVKPEGEVAIVSGNNLSSEFESRIRLGAGTPSNQMSL